MGKLEAVIAIGALTAIELIALYKNVDGQVLSFVVALIAGLGGYTLGKGKTTKNSS